MSSLTITIIQPDLRWEDKEANLAMLEERIMGIKEKTEVVVLPEMFSTGFSMRPEVLAERMDGSGVAWMRRVAARRRVVLTGSLIIEEGGNYYNRLIWMLPNGQMGMYDKRHRFAYAGEDEHYTAGTKRLIASVKGWRLNLQVCYDLRFPVWARQAADPVIDMPGTKDLSRMNLELPDAAGLPGGGLGPYVSAAEDPEIEEGGLSMEEREVYPGGEKGGGPLEEGAVIFGGMPNSGKGSSFEAEPPNPEYDILVYVANWPERRSHAWKTLLQARAIENQVFVVGVNRVGNDGNKIYHSGDSMIVDPLGAPVFQAGPREEIFTYTLERSVLEEVRARFPFWRDRDRFTIQA